MIWFERWISEAYSVRQLSDQSGYSERSLNRLLSFYLRDNPKAETVISDSVKHIVFDGTYLHRPNSIVGLMNGENHELVDAVYGISENKRYDLLRYFRDLAERGLHPESVTLDGNPTVIQAFQDVWPEIIIQRCTVHVQRQGMRWCRAFPKRADALKLREILNSLSWVHDEFTKDCFIEKVRQWERRYGEAIQSRTEKGWVFSDLKRARSMLLKAIPNLFHFVDNQTIPSSTNMMEGYFSRLKARYRKHRGMATHNLGNYFKWYFYFCRK
jgi:hypothetical protein